MLAPRIPRFWGKFVSGFVAFAPDPDSARTERRYVSLDCNLAVSFCRVESRTRADDKIETKKKKEEKKKQQTVTYEQTYDGFLSPLCWKLAFSDRPFRNVECRRIARKPWKLFIDWSAYTDSLSVVAESTNTDIYKITLRHSLQLSLFLSLSLYHILHPLASRASNRSSPL